MNPLAVDLHATVWFECLGGSGRVIKELVELLSYIFQLYHLSGM